MTRNDRLKELFQRAKSFSKDGKHEEAIRSLKEITRRAPEKAIFWCILGDAYHDSGDHTAAMRAYEYETAIKKEPDHQLSQLALAQACMNSGELARAEGWLMTALNSPKDHNMVYSLLGVLRGRQERWKESEEYCRKALDFDPSYEEAHLNLGISLLQQRWIETLPVAAATENVLHFANPRPVTLKVDGRRSQGVILKKA